MLVGLVGQIQSNGDSTMTLSDCINNGNVTGSSDYIGGLLGYIGRNNNIAIAISSCVNNGNVTGDFFLLEELLDAWIETSK